MTDVVRILESTLECQVYEQQTSRPGSSVSSSSGWMGNYRGKKILLSGFPSTLSSTLSEDDLRGLVDDIVVYDPKKTTLEDLVSSLMQTKRLLIEYSTRLSMSCIISLLR